jgi:peptidoglycan/xylan/chitin deacetylase (PgdA/CDA1 family)
LRTARAMGMQPIMWSVTAYDWSAKSAAAIVLKATSQVASRRKPQSEIVLLHDGGHLSFGADRSYTVEATRQLLQQYADKKFAAISQLTGYSG